LRHTGAVGPVVLLLGVAAALLMVLTEVSNLFEIHVDTATCKDLADPELADSCEQSGGEQHSYALLPLALLTALMAVGGGLGGSRPAGIALLGAGIVVLVITLIGDLPDTNESGEIGTSFTSAEAVRGSGFWFELVAGLLATAAGALRLAWRRRPSA
jgi:hypothetical protein